MLRKKYEKENFAAPRVRIFFDTRSDGNKFFPWPSVRNASLDNNRKTSAD